MKYNRILRVEAFTYEAVDFLDDGKVKAAQTNFEIQNEFEVFWVPEGSNDPDEQLQGDIVLELETRYLKATGQELDPKLKVLIEQKG